MLACAIVALDKITPRLSSAHLDGRVDGWMGSGRTDGWMEGRQTGIADGGQLDFTAKEAPPRAARGTLLNGRNYG